MQHEFSGLIFEKSSNIRFHIHPSSGSQTVPCGQSDRKTDWAKLIATFRKCADAPKNTHITTSARTAYEASLTFSLIVMYVTRGVSPGNRARPQNM